MMKLYVANIGILDDEKTYESYLSKVNEQRRAKVLRCKNAEDRRRALLAGVLLARGLAEAGYCYEELDFAKTPEGKPYVKGESGLHYSISHSGSYAVCLIANSNVGVDVETTSRSLLQAGKEKQCLAMAKKSFTEEEYNEFVQLPEEVKVEAFLKNWTRKEAVSKALGKGLAMDFSRIAEPEEKYVSFWLDENHYISVYSEVDKIGKEDVQLCMMN